MGDLTIGSGTKRRVQVRTVSERGWTRRKRAAFLDMLAATCNVSASADFAGMAVTGAYQLRRRDAEFAELWRAALLTGYDRLEEKLLAHAGAGVNQIEPGETEIPPIPFDPRLALDLLRHHRGTVTGDRRKRHGGALHRASRAEAEAALLKKLAAVEKRLREEGVS